MDHQTSYVPLIAYDSPQSLTQPLTEFPQMDSGLAVPVFNQGDDPIACLNKAMAFLSAIAFSRFLSMNNQLRTSSNPRNQDTIQDDRVTIQQVQGRQGQSYAGTSYKGTARLVLWRETQSMVVLKIEVSRKQLVEQMRFDDPYETDIVVIMKWMND
ncbi:hypothetical protein Tco_0236373 [Tanacetum coccineum]